MVFKFLSKALLLFVEQFGYWEGFYVLDSHETIRISGSLLCMCVLFRWFSVAR